MKNIIEECYKKSVDLLIKNSTSYGLMASSLTEKAKSRNYTSVFARDTGICALGMTVSGNKKLIKIAERSLISLANYQADNGQIPNFVRPELNKADFWYVNCIDATLWWLIAVKYFDKYAKPYKSLEKRLAKNIIKALLWLHAHEHPKFFLLTQNEASDWADIMPRSGFVLYTNALWYWLKKLYGIQSHRESRLTANYLFSPWQKIPDNFFKKNYRAKRLIKMVKAKLKKQEHLISFINYSFWGDDADVLANSLAIAGGLVNGKKTEKVYKSVDAMRKKKSLPVAVLYKPVLEKSELWRPYMLSHKQNYPYQYQNGGIWPFASAFWVIALSKAGKKKEAEDELAKIALANSKNNWQFNEWLSPKTGQPMGMSGQSWNAGAFLLAYWYLKGKIKI